MGEMPCDVCGSFQHDDHPSCGYCGSDRHVEHPSCAVCGSWSHETHPCEFCGSDGHDGRTCDRGDRGHGVRCGYCGSYEHEEHTRCGNCGSDEHEDHPRCPVCGTFDHIDHEEDYLIAGDIGLYWITLRVFSDKMAVLLATETTTEPKPQDATEDLLQAFAPEEPEAKARRIGLTSTTNVLAALLKVPVPHDLFVGTNERAFARTLLELAQEHLTKFSALTTS